MSFTAAEPSRVVPAQLATLSIYNPSLGATDETVRDQILYYYSRKGLESQTNDLHDGNKDKKQNEEEENEKLRQVGLAQGMVNFANNFSNGKSVKSIETEKSRVIVHELERGWWILASIDLTRILQPPKTNERSSKPQIEYSTREVSPPQLLLNQVLRAQRIFLLHHAATLSDLYQRLGRVSFTKLLEKYWKSFALSWDVLLHGNPAADLYNGVKLAAGGELGVGVGEEEFGSGEREVLEDFVTRTEGLVDLVVSRFGDAPEQPKSASPSRNGSTSKSIGQPSPWLGTDSDPRSSDGVVFSGVGAVSRRSLATISQWMEAIFKNEEDAYGVGESPMTSRDRKKRGKASTKTKHSKRVPEMVDEEAQPVAKPGHGHAPDLRRAAIERSAASPNIPPSLVPAVEASLDKAVAEVESKKFSKHEDNEKDQPVKIQESSVLGTDKMMKYLSLGYGSAWTLSPKGLPGNKVDAEENKFQSHPSSTPKSDTWDSDDGKSETSPLQQVDPTPEVSDDDEPFVQRLEQSIGKFIIGLSGDLENTEFVEDEGENNRPPQQVTPQRMFLRTLTLGMSTSTMGPVRRTSHGSSLSRKTGDEPPTSASASVDGAQSIGHHQKLQVAVYVHQPFMFVFLFQLHTPSLAMPSFYRNIHHQLGPLQKPLLKSTDPANVAMRIADAIGENSSNIARLPNKDNPTGDTIYDIIYDPGRLTVRTSIPNIPSPGSLAAEGLSTATSSLTISGSWYTLGIPIGTTSSFTPTPSQRIHPNMTKSNWTRIEALNVHTQLLNTWIATRESSEVERTVKTARGWWILWMQVSSGYGPPKEAFLVRKAADHKIVLREREKGRSGNAGRWLLRDQSRDASGSSVGSSGAGDQATTSAGVSEGVGVDARKWIDGLLRLSR